MKDCSNAELGELQIALSSRDPIAILKLAFSNFEKIAISFSGAEAVLIDMAVKLRENVSVFTLDTGRLHPETYRFIERIRERYPVQLEILQPDHRQVQELVNQKGLFSFYADGHQECCHIRKVKPLSRRLRTLDAWITGQRRDQSKATRQRLPVLERDGVFSTPDHTLIKFNPLANWSSGQLWDYIKTNDVPFNQLHAQGYVSIGCEPCTRAILPHEHERAGRWWWEDAAKKECGLHSGNLRTVDNASPVRHTELGMV